MQTWEGRSLLPLLQGDETESSDRELFIHCGRWNEGKREATKYVKSGVRTDRWRLINNAQLFDISADPGESTDVAAGNPDVVNRLQAAFDKWWETTLPLMVNEDLDTVRPEDQPFAKRFAKQKQEQGIPNWAPDQTFTLKAKP